MNEERPEGTPGATPDGAPAAARVRVWLPSHLRTLAKIEGDGEVTLDVSPPVTQRTVLDALEARYPMLRGTIRDHATRQRRAFLRFFACQEDWSHESPDAPLPEAVASGKEPFMVVGAVAGG
jgi:molybdopterin synthase sulfur carrier subunit